MVDTFVTLTIAPKILHRPMQLILSSHRLFPSLVFFLHSSSLLIIHDILDYYTRDTQRNQEMKHRQSLVARDMFDVCDVQRDVLIFLSEKFKLQF